MLENIVKQPMINPRKIYYMQNSIGRTFSDGRFVLTTKVNLETRKLSKHRIPPIRVFTSNNNVFTEDNRRLFAMKELNRIPVHLTTYHSVPRSKFTSRDGTSILLR